MNNKEVPVKDSALLPATEAPAALARPVDTEIGSILREAVAGKLDVASIQALVALKNQQDDRAAARDFYDALAEFQRTCPEIVKSSTADFATDAGVRVTYKWARLDEIIRTIREPLARCGLSYSWSSEVSEGRMVVTCTVRHRNGHAQAAAFTAIIKGTRLMSESQAAGSAVTFAERYSLIQALGLTTAEDDVDGQKPGAPEGEAVCLSADQETEIIHLLDVWGEGLDDATKAANRKRFLAAYRAENVSKILAADYADAVKGLKGKIKQKGAPKA